MYQAAPGSQAEQVGRLIIAGILIVFAPALPFGQYFIYPFTILSTWFHEMGHGFTAMIFGYDFEQLIIFPNGSGLAESRVPANASNFSRIVIAAGGPLWPCLMGSLLILASSQRGVWRLSLVALAILVSLSTAVWVHEGVATYMLPTASIGLVLLAWKGSPSLVRFMLQFIGMLAILSMFMNWNYLFSDEANIGGQIIKSDTGVMAENSIFPHWAWALILMAIATAMVGVSLKLALNHSSPQGR